ncbi:MAG: CHAP domain-containing protein [Candidatus Eremiobacteraeota bacterium]|nr:CHAP domain-containing protein [Candidatus Eremiobacteraeota bacterium]
MMSMAAFVYQVYGERVTAPGALGGQCVDLIDLYLGAIYNIPPRRANAVDWPTQALPEHAWVPNTPTNAPDLGDIVVWGPDAALGIGNYGHVAIAFLADEYELITFDQNWPSGSPCDLVLHSYNGVLGWFHHVG